MSELDSIIYLAGIAGLGLSIIRRQAFIAAFLLCLSFYINELIFIENPSWSELSRWFFIMAAKDYLIAVTLGFRHKTTEFMLSMLFIASCLFHLLAQIEIYNQVLNLKYMRSQFMMYVTAAQLATMYLIILTEGGEDGGKRVKHGLSSFNHLYSRLFLAKTLKA